jgi:hypothetical protein
MNLFMTVSSSHDGNDYSSDGAFCTAMSAFESGCEYPAFNGLGYDSCSCDNGCDDCADTVALTYQSVIIDWGKMCTQCWTLNMAIATAMMEYFDGGSVNDADTGLATYCPAVTAFEQGCDAAVFNSFHMENCDCDCSDGCGCSDCVITYATVESVVQNSMYDCSVCNVGWMAVGEAANSGGDVCAAYTDFTDSCTADEFNDLGLTNCDCDDCDYDNCPADSLTDVTFDRAAEMVAGLGC